MVYKQRSKYTPGGGVLAFFEQVSRFISLSVAGWIFLSVFFILFGTDSKVTDSFSLRLFSSLFTDGQYLMTALMLIGMSGILGALIALPSAFTLLLCRQYLDFQLIRLGSRRYSFVRERVLRYVPVGVLLLSHLFVLLLSLASAPQLSRSWINEGNKPSEWLAGGHFVLTSLTRGAPPFSAAPLVSSGKNQKSGSSFQQQGSRVHIFLVPAEQMDNLEFREEIEKLNKAVSVPFIIQRSSINEQLDSLMLNFAGDTPELARKALSLPKSYNRIVTKKNSQAIVSISPQIRFGKELAGYGTEYLTGFNDSIMHQETQRRLVLSQVHLFGVFRAFNGVPLLSPNLHWLNLIADDVARIREASSLVAALDSDKNSIIIVQLFGLEHVFTNVNPPFRPVGWQLNQASYEKRMVSKKITRELFQYLNDFAHGGRSRWIMLPYADDKRLNPRSFAIYSRADEKFSKYMGVVNDALYTNEDVARALSDAHMRPATVKTNLNAQAEPRSTLECYETELDLKSPEFSFQPIFSRERSLGQLLNYLPQMRDSDLSFLGRSGTSFVTRELGLGFLCRHFGLGRPEYYLLKFRGTREQLTTSAATRRFYSVFVEWGEGSRSDKIRLKGLENRELENSDADVVNISKDVLREFTVTKLTKEPTGIGGDEQTVWKLLDYESTNYFFERFNKPVLEAIEISARARIR